MARSSAVAKRRRTKKKVKRNASKRASEVVTAGSETLAGYHAERQYKKRGSDR
jgi:hypothetical protein